MLVKTTMLFTARLPCGGFAAPFPGSQQWLVNLWITVEDKKGEVGDNYKSAVTDDCIPLVLVLPPALDVGQC